MKKQIIIIIAVVIGAIGFYLFNEQRKKKAENDKKKKEEEEKKKLSDKIITPQGAATLGATYGNPGGDNMSPVVPLTPPTPIQNKIASNDAANIGFKPQPDVITVIPQSDKSAELEGKMKEDLDAKAKADAESLRIQLEAQQKADQLKFEEENRKAEEIAAAAKKAEEERLAAEAVETARIEAETNLRMQEDAKRQADFAASRKVKMNPIEVMKEAQRGRTLAGKGIGIMAAPLTLSADNPIHKIADNMWSGKKADGSNKTLAGNVIGKVASSPVKIAAAPVKALSKLFKKR